LGEAPGERKRVAGALADYAPPRGRAGGDGIRVRAHQNFFSGHSRDSVVKSGKLSSSSWKRICGRQGADNQRMRGCGGVVLLETHHPSGRCTRIEYYLNIKYQFSGQRVCTPQILGGSAAAPREDGRRGRHLAEEAVARRQNQLVVPHLDLRARRF